MYIEMLRLINFRNYNKLNIKLDKNINVFLGKNAQGKTNLLESIYMCATGRSFRTNKDKETIKFNKNSCYASSQIYSKNLEKLIEVKVERNKGKRIRINKMELTRNKELYDGLNVVIFSPEDLRLIKDGPSQRRNFLDNEISQIKPIYRYNINRYNKILFQRNNLLKNTKYNDEKKYLLDIFDLQLVKIGTDVILDRIKFLNKLNSISRNIHSKITNGQEELSLKYISNVKLLSNKNIVRKNFLNKLKQNIDKDKIKGFTQIGPHRDDIEILINNINSKSFASQGQQRTAALSMKLAEVELIKEEKKDYPVLLLDDVLSELDIYRRKYLLNTFKNLQIIITSTESDVAEMKELSNLTKKIFHIDKGNVI